MQTSPTGLRTRGLGLIARLRTTDRGALVLALALPLVFLHRDYNPGVSLGVGSTTTDVTLADVGILAVVAAALVSARRDGFRRLLAARALLAFTLAYLLWILASVAYGAVGEAWYPVGTHLTTALKYAEYALLAFAIPLVVRRRSQLVPAAIALACWSAAATAVGLLQFAGALGDLDKTPAGRRKPSFLGYHDFATLSAMAVLLAAVLYTSRSRRPGRQTLAVAVAGALGMVLSGPLGVMLGTFLALAALLVLGRLRLKLGLRQASVLVGVWLAVLGGVVLIRSSTIDQGLRFLGLKQKTAATSAEIQSYAHRSLLAYLGFRIWLDHPLLGVGWQGSADLSSYAPYLEDAHRRFDQPESAFPSAERRWGVQNAFVQALADLGAVGFALLAGLLLAAVATGARLVLRGPPDLLQPALWATLVVLLVAGVWNDVGLVAAIPIEAALWLAVGVLASVAAIAQARPETP